MRTISLVGRVRKSLWFGCVLVALLVVTIVVIGFDVRKNLDEVISENNKASLIQKVKAGLHQLNEQELSFFTEIADPASRSREMGRWAKTREELGDNLSKVSAELHAGESAGLKLLVQESQAFLREYTITFERVSSEASVNDNITFSDWSLAQGQMRIMRERGNLLIAKYDDRLVVTENESLRRERRIEREMAVTMFTALLLGVITIAVMLWIASTVPFSLKKTLNSLTESVEEVSMGKRLSPISASGISDFMAIEEAVERLRISVNGMLQRLVKTR